MCDHGLSQEHLKLGIALMGAYVAAARPEPVRDHDHR
jgi:hypothetical protein